jgi:endo-1,4-beta-xylanase
MMKKTLITLTAALMIFTGCAAKKSDGKTNFPAKESPKIDISKFDPEREKEALAATPPVIWTEVPGVKDAMLNYFDYFGFCVSYNNTFKEPLLQKGLPIHASVITMENEFKPDFIFGWNKFNKFAEFCGEDGKYYKVPADIPNFKQMDSILSDMKKLGLKLRGHTLVWHSQTPVWFFQKNYGFNDEKELVGPDEMNARMEWYIKTVLDHVAEWEKKNNNGEHMIIAWDVVNEAASDNATDTSFLRDAGTSNWFAIYGNETFIVNAFRYANKYAPKDVKLVYNDYGCASPAKNKAICKIIDAIQAAPDARIDAAGMQTHIGIYDSAKAFETAVKNFLAKGINVQITEMDVANGNSSYNAMKLKDVYYTWIKMFIDNRKEPGKNGIEGVTLWGVRDEWTWLNSMHKGHTQYPLLFNDNEFHCKPAYYGVMEAAQK